MTHQLDHSGVDEARIAETFLRQFGRLPDSLKDAPELMRGLAMFLRAFSELSSCRYDGGPIPWTAIREWCDENMLIGDQRKAVFYHVRDMDMAFLEHKAKKRPGSTST